MLIDVSHRIQDKSFFQYDQRLPTVGRCYPTRVTRKLAQAARRISRAFRKDPNKAQRLTVNIVAVNFFKSISPRDTNKPIRHRNKLLRRVDPKLKRLVCRELLDREPLKTKYKQRRWEGHSYKYYVEQHLLHLLKEYQIAYGQVYVSRYRLAKELSICMKKLDMAIKVLQEWGVITVISGKASYTSNIYIISGGYDKIPTRAPEDYRRPHHIRQVIARKLLKEKCIKLKQWIYEHILEDITHHLLRKVKFIRSYEEKKKKFLENGSDPPKKRRRLSCWHLLKPFKLSYKDRAILSSFGEASLRPAIDDLHYFEKKGNEVTNLIAFLISRCKHHRDKLKQRFEAEQPCDPEKALEWIKSFLTSMKSKLTFISKESDLDRSTNKTKPFVLFLQSLDSTEKSIFRIYQKVQGVWIDKEFNFCRPDFKIAVLDYFEQSFKGARAFS